MAAGAKYKVCLDDLLSSVPSQEKLDTQISDDVHLEEIGAKILNWKGLRAYLGLSRQEEEAIDCDVVATERKRVAMLLKWKEKLGVGATYRSLAGAFHSAGRASLVGVICEVLGAEPSPLLSSEDQELNGATVHNSPDESIPINMEAIDDTELGEGDHFEVLSALNPVAKRWRPVGLALGLLSSQMEEIHSKYSDPEDCLDQVVILWLRKRYDTGKFGCPCWRKLVEAVAHPVGGKNVTLAREIASSHHGLALSVSGALPSAPTQSKVPTGPSASLKTEVHVIPTSLKTEVRTGPVFQEVPHSDTRLGDNDHREIVGYFAKLSKGQVTELGVQLGLHYRWLSDRESSVNYRHDVASAWLRMQDNVKNVCPPTWRNLVTALQGVNQNGIAHEVQTDMDIEV